MDKSPEKLFYFVEEISEAIKQRHDEYMAKPKRDGSQRKGGVLRHFEPSEEFKAERKDNWEIMFEGA